MLYTTFSEKKSLRNPVCEPIICLSKVSKQQLKSKLITTFTITLKLEIEETFHTKVYYINGVNNLYNLWLAFRDYNCQQCKRNLSLFESKDHLKSGEHKKMW